MPRQIEVECGVMMLTAAIYRMFKWRFNFGGDATNLRMLVAYTIGVGKNPWVKYNTFRSKAAAGPSEADRSSRKRTGGGGDDDGTTSSFSAPAPSGGGGGKKIKKEPGATHTQTAFNFRFQWASTNGSVMPPPAPVVATATPEPTASAVRSVVSTHSALGAWLNADVDTPLPSSAGRRSWDR
jgi:hypothetical protein